MREIVHLQAGQCGNQIGAKVDKFYNFSLYLDGISFSSFGKLFRMNMVLIQLVHTMAIPIFNSNELTFISMKLQVTNLKQNENLF